MAAAIFLSFCLQSRRTDTEYLMSFVSFSHKVNKSLQNFASIKYCSIFRQLLTSCSTTHKLKGFHSTHKKNLTQVSANFLNFQTTVCYYNIFKFWEFFLVFLPCVLNPTFFFSLNYSNIYQLTSNQMLTKIKDYILGSNFALENNSLSYICQCISIHPLLIQLQVVYASQIHHFKAHIANTYKLQMLR